MKTLDICEKMTRLSEDYGSNVYGRRNWVVRIQKSRITDEYIIFFAGGMGEAKRNGSLGCMLKTLVELDVTWFYYTYKKDFIACLSALKAVGVHDYGEYKRYKV